LRLSAERASEPEENHENQYSPSHGSSLVTIMGEAKFECLASYAGEPTGLSDTAAQSLQRFTCLVSRVTGQLSPKNLLLTVLESFRYLCVHQNPRSDTIHKMEEPP